MELIHIALIILVILLAFMVIKLVTKILFRLIIIVLIIIGGLIAYQQLLGTNIIDGIENLYCQGENIDTMKCSCFVRPILSDLNTRFSPEQLKDLKSNNIIQKLRANTEFIKSYSIKENEMKMCFETLGQSSGILEEIYKDIKRSGLKKVKDLKDLK